MEGAQGSGEARGQITNGLNSQRGRSAARQRLHEVEHWTEGVFTVAALVPPSNRSVRWHAPLPAAGAGGHGGIHDAVRSIARARTHQGNLHMHVRSASGRPVDATIANALSTFFTSS